jgi:hypothetical protein
VAKELNSLGAFAQKRTHPTGVLATVVSDSVSGSAIDVVDPHAVAASAPPAMIISRQRCSQLIDYTKASSVLLRCAGIHGLRLCRSVPR